jgi:membrane-bound serine protease (ClpP class)
MDPDPRVRGGTMRRLILIVTLLLGAPPLQVHAADPVVHLLPYQGAITPVSAEYLVDGIAEASSEGAAAVLIELDTPGGLDTAMRAIVKAELNADIPVIVYVAPSGSRAASAGAYITMAAHVAAMAPGTNIGSGTPVGMAGAVVDSTMTRKVVHDAIAYLQSIAEQRGRNVELARRIVEDAENLSASRAVEENVVDLVSESRRSLLEQIDGRLVQLADREHRLETAGAIIESRPMSARQRFLRALVDPNVAYLLFLLGIYGIFFELANPGSLAPGILGGISLILALYAFQSLPTNYAGVALLLVGVIMFILEVKVTSFGALTLGGLVAMVLGSMILFDTPGDWARLSLRVVLPVVLLSAGFFVLCVWLVVRGQRRAVITGGRAMVGEIGRVVEPIGAAAGKVVVHGEMWSARSDEPIDVGDRVEVEAIEGRIAHVHRVAPEGDPRSGG